MKRPYVIRGSDIHGSGVYATKNISKGDVIIAPYYKLKRFKGFNHSCRPNLKLNFNSSDGLLYHVVLRDIKRGDEIVVNYTHNLKKIGAKDLGFICNCKKCRKR